MKTKLGPKLCLYPSLTVLLGAHVDGKANFITVAHLGILNYGSPQYISFGMHKSHHTNLGIHEHREFSVNIPSEDLIAETDYCGIVSGKKTDKSGVFELFYGQLQHAPMIQSCPVTMECVLHDTLTLGEHEIFIGEVANVHAEEAVLTDKGDDIDVSKVRPLLFDMALKNYWALGAPVGKCWKDGLEIKKKLKEQTL